MPKRQRIYDYFYEVASEALHIVIFENFVKSMTSCLLKLKVTPSFCLLSKSLTTRPHLTNIKQFSCTAVVHDLARFACTYRVHQFHHVKMGFLNWLWYIERNMKVFSVKAPPMNWVCKLLQKFIKCFNKQSIIILLQLSVKRFFPEILSHKSKKK